MALLFAGGVMNVLWIAVLAVLVLLEKVTPFGRAWRPRVPSGRHLPMDPAQEDMEIADRAHPAPA